MVVAFAPRPSLALEELRPWRVPGRSATHVPAPSREQTGPFQPVWAWCVAGLAWRRQRRQLRSRSAVEGAVRRRGSAMDQLLYQLLDASPARKRKTDHHEHDRE